MLELMKKYTEIAELIRLSKHMTAFCGAGISVESGIPPFRGEDGLWSKYDAGCLDLDVYLYNPQRVWRTIKEIFYDFFGEAKPNAAHYGLAELERKGILKALITQNIDNLHQEAGSVEVIEYHGNSHSFVCQNCFSRYHLDDLILTDNPPYCKKCGGLLKPDFIFFGEMIPQKALSRSFSEAEKTDLMLVIGTTGEIVPASYIPHLAKQNGAVIVEINPGYSSYKSSVTDIHICEKAGSAMTEIMKLVNNG